VWRWRVFRSLAAKFSLVFSIVVAASAVVLAFSSYLDGREVLQREARARYESIVTNMAFNAEYGVLTRNVLALQQIVQGVMQEEDVNFAEALDASGAGSELASACGACESSPDAELVS